MSNEDLFHFVSPPASQPKDVKKIHTNLFL